MTTKIPVELSSTPGIVDGSNATAITISSAEKVTFAKDIEIQGDSVSGSEGGHITLRAASGGSKEFGIDVDSSNNLRFLTEDDGTGDNGAAHVYLTNTGNVGIGTPSPAEKLSINNASGNAYLQCISGNGNLGGVWIGDQADNFVGGFFYDNAVDASLFYVNNAERMRIDSSGNLLVGRTSAEGNTTGLALQVNAANKYCSTLHNNGDATNRFGIQIMAGTYDNSGTNTHVSFGDGNGDGVGTITSSGGTVTYGAFTAHHEVNVPDSDNPSDDSDAYPYGTLVEIVSVYLTDSNKRQSIRYTVQKSQSANSKKVLGAYASNMRPSPMCPTTGTYANNLHNISILGDGHVLCNNTGGNIEVGDGICTSAVEGIGMKATTNPSMIVAIAQEDVTFSGSETKLVAVQFGVQQFTPWS